MWRGVLGARVVLAVVFMGLFFALAWANLFVADRVAPPFRLAGPEDELLERYHDAGRRAGGPGAHRRWPACWRSSPAPACRRSGTRGCLFTNGGDFGVDDPQFGSDVGFYVFQLPFLSFVVDWLFASLLIVLIVTAVAHYLNGGIRVQPPRPRVSAAGQGPPVGAAGAAGAGQGASTTGCSASS